MVILYEHIGCKSMSGYHGSSRRKAGKPASISSGQRMALDPRAASRADMRNEVNLYMRSVLKEEPWIFAGEF
jgi:hypothetical protein